MGGLGVGWSTSEGAGTSPGHADSEERLGDWDGHGFLRTPVVAEASHTAKRRVGT